MPILIPTRSDLPSYEMQLVLDAAIYTLAIRWNVRLSAWFRTIFDSEGINCLQGDKRIVVTWSPEAYITGHQPPGLFIGVDTSGAGIDPGRFDLGNRVQLVYYSQDELNSARG